jgi:hypothetical protein
MGIEHTSVRALAERMGTLPAELRTELRPKLLHAASLIASDARNRASWSTRIPGAISVSASFNSRTGGASVRVSARKAPHARPYEGIDGNATFRRQVYGKAWVTQETRPFLMPARRAKEATAIAEIAAAVAAVNNVGI